MITSSPQLFSRLGSSSCKWVIRLRTGSRVRLWFDALKMNGDSIIIRDGNDSSAPQLAIIKDDKYKKAIVSTGNTMYIFYKHNGVWTNGTRRGFTASYRTESKLNWHWALQYSLSPYNINKLSSLRVQSYSQTFFGQLTQSIFLSRRSVGRPQTTSSKVATILVTTFGKMCDQESKLSFRWIRMKPNCNKSTRISSQNIEIVEKVDQEKSWLIGWLIDWSVSRSVGKGRTKWFSLTKLLTVNCLESFFLRTCTVCVHSRWGFD